MRALRLLSAPVFLLGSLAGCTTAATQPRLSSAGIYDGGQTEIAAWLRLGEDGRFDYALSYGGLDEIARGGWSEAEGGIILDSDPVAAPAFSLTGSEAELGEALLVTLDVPEPLPVELFSLVARYTDGSEDVVDFTGAEMTLAPPPGERIDEIRLALPVFAVVSPPFAVPEGTGAMHYAFVPNDLGIVDFDHARLPWQDDALVLERHGRTLRFRRAAR